MNTPIVDFVRQYAEKKMTRLHMPGHKGTPFLGCEMLDITEVKGADALYEADGIIAQSEENASALFGTAKTLYSTEGSSQCIRAMLALAKTSGNSDWILAARNCHKSFITGCALLGLDIRWLWDEDEQYSLCRCRVTAQTVRETLKKCETKPVAVYLTSPDYLGGESDIASIAETAHAFGVPLLVDNAHGAYLHFLGKSRHPIDLGADCCCDSAHKTMPVLTGGAYLHIHRNAPQEFSENAKRALSLFGSTSPSYLILQSLDLCNRYLAEDYPTKLNDCIDRLEAVKDALRKNGWQIEKSDPLKLTVRSSGWNLSQHLRESGIECEYEDPDFTVMMITPENPQSDFDRLLTAMGQNNVPCSPSSLRFTLPEKVLTVREAMLRQGEWVKTEEAVGRIAASPTVGCPPAVPVVISGERISEQAISVFRYYGIDRVFVLCE